MNERINQVRTRIQQVMAAAQARYGVDLSQVQVRIDLRGRCAGMAGYKNGVWLAQAGRYDNRTYFMRFNHDMILNDGFNHIVNDTVPHEIAHIVCYMRPELGQKHNSGWKSVCRALGGNGERCHNETVTFAKGQTFQYKTTVGKLINVSERIHRKIQMGLTYTIRRGGGKLHRECEWSRFTGTVKVAEAPAAQVPAVQSPAPVATVPPPSQNVQVVLPQGKSKAEAVRWMIRRAKSNGDQQGLVVEAAITALGMSRNMAKKYVSENWDRA